MPEKDERIRNLLQLRAYLKRRIDKLEKEILRLRQMMEALDDVLLEQTLVTADKLRVSLGSRLEPRKEKNLEEREVVSDNGVTLGVAKVDKSSGSLIFIPSKDILINAKERPISSFLARKIEEYGGKCEIEEFPDGKLKTLKIKIRSLNDLKKIFRLLKWAVIKSAVQ